MRKRLAQLLLTVTTAACCLWGANQVLWMVAEREYETELAKFDNGMFEPAPAPLYYLPHPVTDRRMTVAKPGLPATVWHYSVSEQRLRVGPAAPAGLPGDRRKILFIGDSYTFGECIDWADTFVQVIQRRFGASGIAVECINAGVPGYNSEQAYGMLLAVFDRFQPDVVVLGYVANDAQAVRLVPRHPEYTFRYAASILTEVGKPFLNTIGRALVRDEPLLQTSRLDGGNDYKASFQPGHVGRRESQAYLAAMHGICQKRGVPFQVFALPSFIWPLDARYGFFFVPDSVEEWGQAAGYPVSVLLPHFLGEDNARLSVPGDGHPNVEAHRRMAALMFEQLRPLLR